MEPTVIKFTSGKRERSINACLQCRTQHRKCVVDERSTCCTRCKKQDLECRWDVESEPMNKKPRVNDENVFAKMFKNDQTKSQFVCATQPLASLLSRDSVLCFDGDVFGLYHPWRGISSAHRVLDKDLERYLEKRGAFQVPSKPEQRHLVALYLDNLYPFYPIVDRDIAEKLQDVPLMLLNAIFVAAVRFDDQLDPLEVRNRVGVFYERCEHLELIEDNKVVLIQSFLLLSTHEEGVNGSSSSKQYIAKACNLCGELAITNLDNVVIEADLHTENQYSHSLLARIIWVTFCCDRLVSATSGREMVLNQLDMMVDPIKIEDFEQNMYQEAHFKLFTSWFQLCKLIDRVQTALYRPPINRNPDPNLEADLTHWQPPSLPYKSHVNFLMIVHSYVYLLYLRWEVDSISFLQAGPTVSQIHSVSLSALDLIKSQEIQHVVVVHVILHIIALLQLEWNTRTESSTVDQEFEAYFQTVTSRALEELNRLKKFWWFAGASLLLCKEMRSADTARMNTV